MKISQKKLSLIATIAIILLIIGKMELFHHYPDTSFGVDSYLVEPTKLDSLDDELRAVNFKLDRLKRNKKIYTEGFDSYNGYTFGPLGIIELSLSDKDGEKSNNYLKLAEVGLKFDESGEKTYLTYQIIKGQPHLVTKKLIQEKNENKAINVYTKVGYRYITEENIILIPIESTFWRMSLVGLSLLIVLFSLALLLFVLFTFFNFLLAVAKNRAFEKDNIQRLRDLSLSLFVLALSPYLISIIIYLIFISNYPSYGVTITRSFFKFDYYVLIFAILSYLFYNAFKKAMTLQQENELTI